MGKKINSGIVIVIGTKAELIKCMPVMLELQKERRDYWFIHTGQHPLSKACEEFGVKKPDFILSKEPDLKKGTKFISEITLKTFLWNFKTMFQIRSIIKKLNPKYVSYHGDTMNTAMAIGASAWVLNPFKKWKTIHLEAGLRSGSLLEPIPEEFTRRVVDRFTDILLAVSNLTEKNLKRYKKKEVIKIGNTIVDSALITYNKAKKTHKKPKYKYALINLHRHENLNSKKRMQKIVQIIKNVKIKVIWPIHNTTKDALKKYDLMKEVKKMKNIEIIPLTDYFKFIFLLANCEYLITDGGSIQEESLIFKKPCVLLRKRTERQEGLDTGINFLTKLDIDYAKDLIEEIENNSIKVKRFKNPYGERGVSKKIVEILKNDI